MAITTARKREILRSLTGWTLLESTHSDRQIEAIWKKYQPRREYKPVGFVTRWENGYSYQNVVIEERWVLTKNAPI